MLDRACLLLLLAVPSWAWACPSCAQRDAGGPASGWLIGSMMLLPFVVLAGVALALRVVLSSERKRKRSDP